MDATDNTTHLAPADQPTSVHQIAERLLPAYTIDGGAVRLAGCNLEDRLFVRFGFQQDANPAELYLDAAGHEIDPTRVDTLGMARTVELAGPAEPDGPEIPALADLGRQLVRDRFPSMPSAEPIEVSAVWCKFAQGKVRFIVGEDFADLPFADWARTLQPPPFVCPYTGISTFHLAATDDGRIVPAEAIEECAETGGRLLSDDLVTCSVTDRRVDGRLAENCPVTGQPVLRKEMVECAVCGELVSPRAVHRGQCEACRKLHSVNKADPRMARVLDEHPTLDRWRNWRISETQNVYILSAAGWFRRLLVVVDRDSLELKSVATGHRLWAGWQVVDPSQYAYVLRG